MGWPNEPSAAPSKLEHWTYLLGETAANSRSILGEVTIIRGQLADGEKRMDFLTEENIRRQHEIAALRSAHQIRHAHASWMESFPALAEKAEMIGGFLKVLGTVKETVVWALSGTAIYQMYASPEWVKDVAHAILVKIGLSL